MYSFLLHKSISNISKKIWDECTTDQNPFLSYIFLKNLEDSRSIGAGTSWIPNYVTIINKDIIVAVCPMYIKLDSQGEYIFDHAWANAYHNAGGEYYPKIQLSVPFTPVAGNRILINKNIFKTEYKNIIEAFAKYLIKLTNNNYSSAHITFCSYDECKTLENKNFLTRIGEQFHWKNANYHNFNDFLNSLNSRKRKAISKERNYIQNKNIKIIHKSGKDITDEDWDSMYDFYQNTTDKKWGNAYLNKEFFNLLAKNFSEKILIIFAQENNTHIAGAMHIIGKKTLFGRYWGAYTHIKYLHFELCYYQAIDWAIKNQYSFVEGGAQGPHKIQRGYLPEKTYSSHYIADNNFRKAVQNFLLEESKIINNDINLIKEKYTPFKKKIS